MVNSLPGRPSVGADVRNRLLNEAKRQFLEESYGRVSVRKIAQNVGVSHAMVNYYFGSKERLFAEAMALIAAPTDVLSRALVRSPNMSASTRAHHLIETFLDVWEADGNAERIADVWFRTMNDPRMKNAVPQFFTDHVIAMLAQHIRGRDASIRAAGVSAVLMGMATSRFLLRLEPLASMPRDHVVRTLTPAIAVYLR